MKTLQDYMEAKQTALLEKTDAFFAFSQEQYSAKKKFGVKYTSLEGGMICPSENVDELLEGLMTICRDAIAEDIAENGMKKIIIRELYNHEAFYTNDLDDTILALGGYKFPDEVIIKIYQEESKNQE